VITLGLDPGQVRAVLDAALSKGDTERNYAVVSLLVVCGLRVSEALGADVGKLGSARGHAVISVVGKGDKPRTVPMPPAVVEAVGLYIGGRADGPVFITGTGAATTRDASWRASSHPASTNSTDLFLEDAAEPRPGHTGVGADRQLRCTDTPSAASVQEWA
jgi:integrase